MIAPPIPSMSSTRVPAPAQGTAAAPPLLLLVLEPTGPPLELLLDVPGEPPLLLELELGDPLLLDPLPPPLLLENELPLLPLSSPKLSPASSSKPVLFG